MNSNSSEGQKGQSDRSDKSKAPPTGTGTEAERKGGIEPAKRQAERDWEDSAKESGD